MEKTWIVYSHTCPNGKIYIGITSKSFSQRCRPHGNGYLRKIKGRYVQSLFARHILKYGWENIQHVILYENLSETEAKEKEKELIKLYKTAGKSLNLTDGGDGCLGVSFHHSDEAKRKIREHHRRGNSPEIIAKIKATMTGQKYSEERKFNCRLGHKHEMMPVLQYDLSGNFISEYECIMDAARATGVKSGNISNCCKGKYKQSGGFIWVLKNKNKYEIENQNKTL